MRRGEVWLLNLDPTVGAEIQKTRPVLIVSSDAIGALPLRVIVPLTDWKERYASAPWMVHVLPTPENGLSKDSTADTFQIRSVSTARFVRKMGILEEPVVNQIILAIGLVVEFPV